MPFLGEFGRALLPLVALNGPFGAADGLWEPASTALFADEGSDNGGIASSFGVRELVRRPGSIVAPMTGVVLLTGVGTACVFYVGAAAAFGGIADFVGILVRNHGRQALSKQ